MYLFTCKALQIQGAYRVSHKYRSNGLEEEYTCHAYKYHPKCIAGASMTIKVETKS